MIKNKPNVILMLVDDLGIGDVSCFNSAGKIKTSHLDQLAESGMRFENSHATSSLCTPSRYSLLTGRYNWRSRLKSVVLHGDSETLIEKNRTTLAQLFKSQGYHTAAVGKWHLGMDWHYKKEVDYEAYGIDPSDYPGEEMTIEEQYGRKGNFDNDYPTHLIEGIDIDFTKKIKYGPLQYGFDYFFGTPASLDQPPFVYIENDAVTEIPTKVTGTANLDRMGASQQQEWQLGVIADNYKHQECPGVMQNKVIEIIEKQAEKEEPFFLYYPCHLVHGPILPDEEFQGTSGLGPYGDFVLQLDHYVGEISQTLKEKNIAENTIFIFTSDNGASGVADFSSLLAQGHNPSSIYRGKKMDIWEGGHIEPTIISYPGHIKANSFSHQLVAHSDLFATFAEMFGIAYEDDAAEDSVSLLPLLKGTNGEIREDIVVSSANGGLAIRTHQWKLNLVKNGGGNLVRNGEEAFGPFELFKIDEDIQEKNNVIDDYPMVVSELMTRLEKYIKEGRSTHGQKQKNERNNPTGNWEAISWVTEYEEYLKTLD